VTVTNRGCKNANERGNSVARRARKNWLLETYASNVRLVRVEWLDGGLSINDPDELRYAPESLIASEEEVPTARCYRCGRMLWFETLTVDRIIPGILGGTYARNNIRPACYDCNTSTGGGLSNRPDLKAAKKRAAKRKAAAKRVRVSA